MQLIDAALAVLGPHPSLEGEGLGDHAHGQRPDLASHLGDDGRRTGPGAATHAGGDEHHVGALEDLAQSIARLEGRGPAAIGIGPAAEAARDLGAELHLDRREVVLERLCVGVGGDELDAAEAKNRSWC